MASGASAMTDLTSKTDHELLQGWRQRDATMGAELFSRHRTAVTNFFRRNVRNISDIPDLVQQTFLGCIEGERDPQIQGTVRGYILGIAFFKMTHYFRSNRHAPQLGVDEHLSGNLASVEPDPEYLLNLGDQQRLLMKAIRRLPLKFQAMIELNYWDNVSCDQIAIILNIPAGTARRRLQAGRKALEEKLAELADSPQLLEATTMSLATWKARIQEWIEAGGPTKAEN